MRLLFTEKMSKDENEIGQAIIICLPIIIALIILAIFFAISINALKQEKIVC